MEVEMVSKRCVKPSSPTPPHLKTYEISLLDQYHLPLHIPVILVYPSNQQDKNLATTSQKTLVLKQSLAETLTLFYPLAGKIKDKFSVDCDDAGAYYVEARANCPLTKYADRSDDLVTSMHKFLPKPSNAFDVAPAGSHVIMIQQTNFMCGGMAICILFSHMVVDGTAASVFLKSWAATARSCSEGIVHPNFGIAPKIFPQNRGYPMEATVWSVFRTFTRRGNATKRRFLFDASSIARLKGNIAASSNVIRHPSSVEVVTALLWKRAMAVFKACRPGKHRPTVINHAVDLRRRTNTAFSESLMGNFVWLETAACATHDEDLIDLANLVWKLRESIARIDSDFVRSLQGDGGLAKICQVTKEMSGALSELSEGEGMDCIAFTSWCKFGGYGNEKIDFGWGKPAGAISSSSGFGDLFMNTVLLMDASGGKGIEALVTLDEQEMAILERDMELLQFASVVDPFLL